MATEAVPSRGDRTRAALLRGAREVFERDGYVDAKITEITKAAGVAAGSFYTHFASKEEIFEAVVAEVHELTLHPPLDPQAADSDDPRVTIAATNRAYVELYAQHARLFALLDQVSTVDEHFRRLRLERSITFAERNAAAIRRWQEAGLADPTLDPLATAHALDAMTSRTANLVFVHGLDMSTEALHTTLTRLWANALRLTSDGS